MYAINHRLETLMNENENARSTSNQKPQGTAVFTALGTAAGLAALPQAFEQYPNGAAVVTKLIFAILACWVVVAWLNNRRK
jgi:hypothetical protein